MKILASNIISTHIVLPNYSSFKIVCPMMTYDELETAICRYEKAESPSLEEFTMLRQYVEQSLGQNVDGLNAKMRRRLKRFLETTFLSKPIEDEPIVENGPLMERFLKSLSVCRTDKEIERALNTLPALDSVRYEGAVERDLKSLLSRLSEQESINRRIRRRLSRLLFSISSEQEKGQLKEIRTEKALLNTKVPPKKSGPKVIAAHNLDRSQKSEVNSLSARKGISQLQQASTSSDIEAAITLLTAPGFLFTDVDIPILNDCLDQILQSKKFDINSKLKRRITRLKASLVAGQSAETAHDDSCAEVSGPMRTVSTVSIERSETKFPTTTIRPTIGTVPSFATVTPRDQAPILSVQQIAVQLSTAASPAAVEAVLSSFSVEGIKGLGPDGVQTIVSSLQSVSDNAAVINAKLRRRLKRTLDMLSPAETNTAGEGEASRIDTTLDENELALGSDMKKIKSDETSLGAEAAKEGGPPKGAPAKVVPLVAFVGQLDFTVTKEELGQHLTESGILFKAVRILTDAATGRSRGMAFIELLDLANLHKTFRLDKTFIMGRRVNVESSSGGGKQRKKTKIQARRQTQPAQAPSAAVAIMC